MRLFVSTFALLALFIAGCKSEPKHDSTPAPNPAASAPAAAATASPSTNSKKSESAMTANSSAGKVECTHKADVRTLEVRTKDKGCELAYTKNGQEAVVSSAKNGQEHCQASLNKIKEKLTAASFTCK